jgi:two-component system chemotaxis response regulator CheB
MSDYSLIAVGGSWGGLTAVRRLLEGLPHELDVPFAIVLHRAAESSGVTGLLQPSTHLRVVEADDKQPIEAGHVYVAPADYHLLVERGAFALSTDARVQYARPSIDVLFASASDAYRAAVVGIVLTGANVDGAEGLARIKAAGGVAIVQSPDEAERRAMPEAAIAATAADAVLPVEEIGPFLHGLCAPVRVPA